MKQGKEFYYDNHFLEINDSKIDKRIQELPYGTSSEIAEIHNAYVHKSKGVDVGKLANDYEDRIEVVLEQMRLEKQQNQEQSRGLRLGF